MSPKQKNPDGGNLPRRAPIGRPQRHAFAKKQVVPIPPPIGVGGAAANEFIQGLDYLFPERAPQGIPQEAWNEMPESVKLRFMRNPGFLKFYKYGERALVESSLALQSAQSESPKFAVFVSNDADEMMDKNRASLIADAFIKASTLHLPMPPAEALAAAKAYTMLLKDALNPKRVEGPMGAEQARATRRKLLELKEALENATDAEYEEISETM